MTMKKILVISIFAASIALAGCGKTAPLEKQNVEMNKWENIKSECMIWCEMMWKWNQSNKNKTLADMNVDCNSLCDAAQWMESNDLSSCQKSEGILKDTCFSEIAQETNDPTICKNITDKTFLYSCYTAIAEKNNDDTLCNNIDDTMRKWICADGAKAE